MAKVKIILKIIPNVLIVLLTIYLCDFDHRDDNIKYISFWQCRKKINQFYVRLLLLTQLSSQ